MNETPVRRAREAVEERLRLIAQTREEARLQKIRDDAYRRNMESPLPGFDDQWGYTVPLWRS